MKWVLIIQVGSYAIPPIVQLVGGATVYYIRDGHVEMKKLYEKMPVKTR